MKSLDKSIGLGVVCCCMSGMNSKHGKKMHPEVWDKLSTTIRVDIFWKTKSGETSWEESCHINHGNGFWRGSCGHVMGEVWMQSKRLLGSAGEQQCDAASWLADQAGLNPYKAMFLLIPCSTRYRNILEAESCDSSAVGLDVWSILLERCHVVIVVVTRSLIGACERASAVTFWSPWMCLMSVVNSEINERWRLWCGLQVSPVPVRAKVSGLWSV